MSSQIILHTIKRIRLNVRRNQFIDVRPTSGLIDYYYLVNCQMIKELL